MEFIKIGEVTMEKRIPEIPALERLKTRVSTAKAERISISHKELYQIQTDYNKIMRTVLDQKKACTGYDDGTCSCQTDPIGK